VGASAEADLSRAQLRVGVHGIVKRPAAFLRAVPFRLLRGTGLYWTADEGRLIGFEGRDARWEAVGRDFHHFVVLPLILVAIAALALPRARLGRALRRIVARRRLILPGTLVMVWLMMIAGTYGSTRFRAPVEPVLSLLAGLAIATVVEASTTLRKERALVT